jgi:hypothetical protein
MPLRVQTGRPPVSNRQPLSPSFVRTPQAGRCAGRCGRGPKTWEREREPDPSPKFQPAACDVLEADPQRSPAFPWARRKLEHARGRRVVVVLSYPTSLDANVPRPEVLGGHGLTESRTPPPVSSHLPRHYARTRKSLPLLQLAWPPTNLTTPRF